MGPSLCRSFWRLFLRPNSFKKFVLHVPITSRPGQKINVKDMKVFVLFYDKLNANDLASTAANVSTHAPIRIGSGQRPGSFVSRFCSS